MFRVEVLERWRTSTSLGGRTIAAKCAEKRWSAADGPATSDVKMENVGLMMEQGAHSPGRVWRVKIVPA